MTIQFEYHVVIPYTNNGAKIDSCSDNRKWNKIRE